MALVFADRVKETTATTGTGTYTLAGPMSGYQSFATAIADASTTYYAATDGSAWEIGLGTFTTVGTTLARTTILASSTGSAISWAAGSKQIWCDAPAAFLASLAPFASPTFTGTPAAPTAAVDTNSTQIATTAFVLGQKGTATPIVDGTGAAGTSNRWTPIDHIHPTDTTRAPLASPAFTGTNWSSTGMLTLSNGTTDAPDLAFNDTVNNTNFHIDMAGETLRMFSSYRGAGSSVQFTMVAQTGSATFGSTMSATGGVYDGANRVYSASSRPTTVSGYGITDAVTLGGVQSLTAGAQKQFNGSHGNSGIGTATGGLGEIWALNNGTGAGCITFHRSGSFACYVGLDTDNVFKIGGWSYGAAAYPIYHGANPPPVATSAQFAAKTASVYLTPANAFPALVTLGTSGTISWDMSTGFDFQIVLTANGTLAFPSNPVAGQKGRIMVQQPAGGSTTLGIAANMRTPGGRGITLSTGGTAIDFIDYDCVNTGYIRLSLSRAWA